MDIVLNSLVALVVIALIGRVCSRLASLLSRPQPAPRAPAQPQPQPQRAAQPETVSSPEPIQPDRATVPEHGTSAGDGPGSGDVPWLAEMLERQAHLRSLLTQAPGERSVGAILAAVASCREALAGVTEWSRRTARGDIQACEEIAVALAQVEVGFLPGYEKRAREFSLVAIVDTETTGITRQDEPISVAVILLEVDGSGALVREVASYHGMREPGVAIHPRAKRVHGMALEDLAGKAFDYTQILRLVGAADVLIAHKASFDRRMLASLIPEIEAARWACSLYDLNHKVGERSLDALCKAHGIERPARHDALSDCRDLTKLLFQHTGKTQRSQTYMKALLKTALEPAQ